MKWLAAGLTFVNTAAVSGLLFGMIGNGLSRPVALLSLGVGLALGTVASLQTRDDAPPPKGSKLSRALFWAVAGCFAFFAFRSFCWLLYIDGNSLKVQSINNLGDLSLHLTYIRNFASGVALWPDNPIFVFSKLRYPAGTDLANALLLLLGVDLMRGLIWAGLIGSIATFYAFYRWSGLFGVAGFLFNGGLTGFAIFSTGKWMDYQADKIAWKSLPLAMFVTQRGLLYALPAGLLLLYQWRAKYLRRDELPDSQRSEAPLPFWLELTLYATMPFFHFHTFLALSVVAAFLFLFGNMKLRKHLGTLVGAALLPATFFVWSITDHFGARSLMKLQAGWVQRTGDMAHPFFYFWLLNFGAWVPLVLALVALAIWRAYQPAEKRFDFNRSPSVPFLIPAAVVFLIACLVKTAPWEWDNIKLIIWAYILVLPFLWTELIGRWPEPARIAVCLALFFSGFVSLFGGLAAGRDGYGIADRAEVDAVGQVVRRLPAEARYAGFPTYNHPLLLQGRKMVLGYPGHLWTQGFDYGPVEQQLKLVMQGAPNWREQAQQLRARYIFFGREEKANYPTSTRPWEREARLVANGPWGAVYDLEAPPAAGAVTRGQ
jgi:hypothetical protein